MSWTPVRLGGRTETRLLMSGLFSSQFDDWWRPVLEDVGVESIGSLLRSGLPPVAGDVVDIVFRTAHVRPNVDTVAREMAVSRRQLERDFASAELISPHRLVVLTRWIPVICNLTGANRPLARVAADFRFAGTVYLHRAARRELRMSVRELRDRTALIRIIGDIATAYQPCLDA